MIKRPFMDSRSRMAEAVTESKIFPHWEGMRLVVTMVVRTSVRLEMIWNRASACSLEGTTLPSSSRHSSGALE